MDASTVLPGRRTPIWDFPPGLDFETKLFFKPEAAALLRKELSKPSYIAERVQLGANTDCYQPIEKRPRQITREVIKVLAEFQHPLELQQRTIWSRGISTYSLRWRRKSSAVVVISITTLDPRLARAMEPAGFHARSPPGGDPARCSTAPEFLRSSTCRPLFPD